MYMIAFSSRFISNVKLVYILIIYFIYTVEKLMEFSKMYVKTLFKFKGQI